MNRALLQKVARDAMSSLAYGLKNGVLHGGTMTTNILVDVLGADALRHGSLWLEDQLAV